MPYLQLNDHQFPLPPGVATVGAFEGAAVRLPSGPASARAVVTVAASGVVIRRGAPDAVILVNGVQLGMEPSPLLHGDRVVSLVDGREYAVADAGLTFGREVGNGVVLASSEVSRKHATIAPAANGYVPTDHSTNGVWINGTRVAGTQLLGRGDVLPMGSEEFRFYADVAKAAPAAPAVSQSAATVETAPAPAAPVAPVAAAPAPAAAAPRQGRAPLATLEIKADGWWVVDQGSTNGTYVGGRRVQGEQKIEGAPDLRFGGIKMTFRPAAQVAETAGSTRAIAAVDVEAVRRSASPKAAAKPAAAPAPEPTKKSGYGAVIAIFLSLAGAGAGLLAFLLTMVR